MSPRSSRASRRTVKRAVREQRPATRGRYYKRLSEDIFSRYISRIGSLVSLVLLVVVVSFGVYLRTLPILNSSSLGYGTYLDELDPYSNYYVVSYMLRNGPLSFWSLRPPNPAADLFWYPWGRDFTSTDVPGIYYTIYFLYLPFRDFIDLMTFMAYLPVVAAAISLIGLYMVSREISGSSMASVITTGIVATLFMDRTLAGFIVKYTIALMTTPWIIYFFIKGFKTNRTLYYIATGLLLAYSAYSTGLYVAPYTAIYATLLLAPLVVKREELGKMILNTLVMTVPVVLVFLSTPIYGLHYLFRNLGVVPIVVLLMLTAYKHVYIPLVGRRSLLAYTGTLATLVVAGLFAVYTGVIGLSGKAAQALGLFHVLGTLSFTIAEYQPTDMGSVMSLYGPVLVLAVFSILYNMYLTIRKRDLVAFFITVQGVLILYVLTNLSYFISLAILSMAILSSSFLGLLTRYSGTLFTRARRYISLSSFLALVMLFSVLVPHVYVVYSYHIPAYRGHLPMIVTSGVSVNMPSDAWLRALQWIRSNTDPDSVVVAWWDYGYWITPLGGRASVADGSTINGTQIEILARILTTDNESMAVEMMTRDLRLVPNKTYVLVYDVFVVNRYGEYVYPLNWADAAKGVSAVFRIAGVNIDYDIYGNNTPSYYTLGSGPQQYVRVIRTATGAIITPNWASDKVRNTLLYGLMIDGISRIFPGYTFYSANPQQGGTPVERPEFRHFRPAAIIPSLIPFNSGSPAPEEVYVVVFIYQFTG